MPENERGVGARGAESDGPAAEVAPVVPGDVVRLQEEVAGLLRAVETRDVIGQAKGILMERHKLTSDEAFSWLREASQHSNTRVAELARLLTESGQWPPLNGQAANDG